MVQQKRKASTVLLVYECMPNSSLDHRLFIGPDKEPLPWNLRFKIINAIASALHYLHYEYDHKVIHTDLKAGNIIYAGLPPQSRLISEILALPKSLTHTQRTRVGEAQWDTLLPNVSSRGKPRDSVNADGVLYADSINAMPITVSNFGR